MTLSEWRKSQRLTQKEMASKISAVLGRTVQAPNVCQWERGVMPGADVADAIQRVTCGMVIPASFRRG